MEAQLAGAVALGSAGYAFHEHQEKKKSEHLVEALNGTNRHKLLDGTNQHKLLDGTTHHKEKPHHKQNHTKKHNHRLW